LEHHTCWPWATAASECITWESVNWRAMKRRSRELDWQLVMARIIVPGKGSTNDPTLRSFALFLLPFLNWLVKITVCRRSRSDLTRLVTSPPKFFLNDGKKTRDLQIGFCLLVYAISRYDQQCTEFC
jgi:hypothetical protein